MTPAAHPPPHTPATFSGRLFFAAVSATTLALPVDHVLLVQSHLGRAGPTYVELAVFPLR